MAKIRPALLALALAAVAGAAAAQIDKPVRLLVGFAPGGSAEGGAAGLGSGPAPGRVRSAQRWGALTIQPSSGSTSSGRP